MKAKRTDRLNSLLKEVISNVISKEVSNPNISLITITRVDITSDLSIAHVYVSVIANDIEKKHKTVAALQDLSGYIGSRAAKQVVIRRFPVLTFRLDNTLDAFFKIDKILKEIKDGRPPIS